MIMNKNVALNKLDEEKNKVKRGFKSFVIGNEKYNTYLKYGENEIHFAEIVVSGYTLFAKIHEKYDDSIEGTYLRMGIIKGVLIDGKVDILATYEEKVIKNYDFIYDQNAGWNERNEEQIFYSSIELVEDWTNMLQNNIINKN